MNILKHCKIFDDIYDITEDMTKKEKGDILEKITYYLFKLAPMLNNKLEEIFMYEDVPNSLLKKLKLPDKDKGIDLIAKINGEYYAIQSKFRQNPNVSISWAELSTFFGLSFGLHDKIKGGFLVTNTYNLCDEIKKSNKVTPIYGDFFDDNLPENFFENMLRLESGNNAIKYVEKKPFSHQKECIKKCEEHFTTVVETDDSSSDDSSDSDSDS